MRQKHCEKNNVRFPKDPRQFTTVPEHGVEKSGFPWYISRFPEIITTEVKP